MDAYQSINRELPTKVAITDLFVEAQRGFPNHRLFSTGSSLLLSNTTINEKMICILSICLKTIIESYTLSVLYRWKFCVRSCPGRCLQADPGNRQSVIEEPTKSCSRHAHSKQWAWHQRYSHLTLRISTPSRLTRHSNSPLMVPPTEWPLIVYSTDSPSSVTVNEWSPGQTGRHFSLMIFPS
jgi:hypothetical protein